MASGPEIIQYIKDTTAKLGLDKHTRFNSRVNDAVWNEPEGKWNLKSDHVAQYYNENHGLTLDSR